MHIATVEQLVDVLTPAIHRVARHAGRQEPGVPHVVMWAERILQDATPLHPRQVISGWVAQLDQALARSPTPCPACDALAIGGTAVARD